MSNYNQILIQYETLLPDDFDMEQIRTRVRDLGPQTDQYPGLEFKLYGVNTRERIQLDLALVESGADARISRRRFF
jgi:hypothetical protein